MNSSILLKEVEALTGGTGATVSIQDLADALHISLPKLVAVLTELEHRDEIKMEIISELDPRSGELKYSGSVSLMDTPPDEPGDGAGTSLPQ
ncbi:MAG: hypothetical protein JSS82_08340 [Bacteroidetes bacterium]|nr:hypothetical protein [Bacteroidota bacterium]